MNNSYKIAFGSALVLCGAILGYYMTVPVPPTDKADATSQNPPLRVADASELMPPARQVETPIPPPSPRPEPVAPKPAPQPAPVEQSPDPPTITLDGNSTAPEPSPPPPAALPPAPEPDPQPTATPTPTPTPKQYVIQPGDTLVSVATDKYGHEKFWVDIAQANPLKDPTRLYPGDVINLPDPRQVKSRPQLSIRREDGTRAHIVRGGETLTGISKKYYGTTANWRLIYNANRTAIGNDPDRVQAGTQLVIPRRPRVER